MNLWNLPEDEFGNLLGEMVSPGAAVRSFEHLRGREDQVASINQALYSPGRSIFVHGPRGVGKTSVALTTALTYQSSDASPAYVACEPDSTFQSIITDIARSISPHIFAESHEATLSGGFGVRNANVARSMRTARQPASVPTTINEAVQLLRRILDDRSSGKHAIVIDEFDRIKDPAETTRFADFVKQVGDQELNAKFWFCGVGDSVQELMGQHGSAYRYIVAVKLTPLVLSTQWEILDPVAEKLGVTVEESPRIRLAQLCDGFPHYMHLLTEKLMWTVYCRGAGKASVTPQDYHSAVQQAVLGAEEHFRIGYEIATRVNTNQTEAVLFATADHGERDRQNDDIYDSYRWIAAQMGIEVLSRRKFGDVLSSLKSATKGPILRRALSRRSYSCFSESMMRGYVRLSAEARGINLAAELSPEAEPRRITVRTPLRVVPGGFKAWVNSHR